MISRIECKKNSRSDNSMCKLIYPNVSVFNTPFLFKNGDKSNPLCRVALMGGGDTSTVFVSVFYPNSPQKPAVNGTN
jgi:hypothetical protein